MKRQYWGPHLLYDRLWTYLFAEAFTICSLPAAYIGIWSFSNGVPSWKVFFTGVLSLFYIIIFLVLEYKNIQVSARFTDRVLIHPSPASLLNSLSLIRNLHVNASTKKASSFFALHQSRLDMMASSWSIFFAFQLLFLQCYAYPRYTVGNAHSQITAAPALGAIPQNGLLRRQDNCTLACAGTDIGLQTTNTDTDISTGAAIRNGTTTSLPEPNSATSTGTRTNGTNIGTNTGTITGTGEQSESVSLCTRQCWSYTFF